MKLASGAWVLHSALSVVPRRGNHGDCFGTETDELRRDSGEWGERGAQRPDCYDFVQGYSWGEQPGSQVLLWEGRAALFLESWCPLKPCPGFVKQSVLRARWEHSEVGVKKPSSGIVLTFQGQHHSLSFIKVETNARFQMSSPENPPIRGQEIWLPVAVMSPAVWCQAGRRAIPLATRGALEALPSSQP